jgi:hypothetical protein
MDRISPFAPLFRSSPGGKAILRQYLGLEPDTVLPLSLSHGVDFGHEPAPQDYLASEPLHWCYNEDILARTGPAKPGVPLPHPWLMVSRLLADELPARQEGRALIVGPPPSRSNDAALRDALERAGLRADAILVKKRGATAFHESMAFWQDLGVESVSAGAGDEGHYSRLATILARYERVILPVFSSVGVFAAALGCQIVTLTDYWHCSYSPHFLDLDRIARSPTARAFVRLFVDGDRVAQQRAAAEFLGEPFMAPPEELRARLHASYGAVASWPVHVPAAGGNLPLKVFMTGVALAIGRVDFLRYGLAEAIRYKVVGTTDVLVCKRMNMIDALLKGRLDHTNIERRPLRRDEEGARSGEGAVF